MPCQRQRQVAGRDAAAIISDTYQRLATVRYVDRNAPRTSIYGVFHQFLDRRCRPLDHFAGGDTVDRRLVQLANNGIFLADMGGALCHATTLSIAHFDSTSHARDAICR